MKLRETYMCASCTEVFDVARYKQAGQQCPSCGSSAVNPLSPWVNGWHLSKGRMVTSEEYREILRQRAQ